jgi:hypothetical protein
MQGNIASEALRSIGITPVVCLRAVMTFVVVTGLFTAFLLLGKKPETARIACLLLLSQHRH